MLDKAYEPGSTEDRIYKMWEESGAFKADASSKKEAFSISMPPPNATGQLHLGHAVMLALEDIFTRYARMQGKEALWVPGTDHAAIATESLVIRNLQKGGMADPRKQLGREKLLAEIAAFVENSRDTIRGQVRKMGSSCDWSRERYTMEPALNRCVNEVFKLMYDDGLIYRGHRIVNWDPKLQTTVSDEEVDFKEETAPFYTFQYGPFQIGTSRPETKFGDKYVVMHPEDERYAKYKHGDTFEAQWINGPIKATVIKDEAVDPAFGTGVMTITPWHDAIDFEIAGRHGLEREQVIDYNGKLLPIAGDLAGMSIEEARPLIVEKLKAKGLLVKVDENYVHNKATNSRGGGAIEPQIKLQWFIDVNKEIIDWVDASGKNQKMSLKQIMHSVVHHGDITIIPDRFNKTYFHWIDNLRDWCISRQIWWGHRVPVYYCSKCEEAMKATGANHESRSTKYELVSVQPLEKCPNCDSKITQDSDTLDTWFSAALWTWSTLLDPALAVDPKVSFKELFTRSPDFQKFHPTTVMETGYDILFFWVARMILMTTYTLSKVDDAPAKAADHVPFKTVYLHGLIRARDGRKMSKSHPETMIDPLDMISKYGADALRLSMIVGQSAGNDARLYEEKIAGYRNFINKLWNASRFVLMQCEQKGIDPKDANFTSNVSLSLADRALVSHLQVLIDDVTEGLHKYNLSEVGERLYAFIWDFFCDWYLELSKGEANIHLLVQSLRTIIQLLHPFCPFVTEELWAHIRSSDSSDMLISQAWPIADVAMRYKNAEKELQSVIDIITAIRKIRTEQGIEPGKQISVMIKTLNQDLIASQQSHIERMGKCTVELVKDAPTTDIASAFLEGVEVHVSLAGLIDKDKEKASLLAEKEKLSGYAKSLEAKLSNEAFVARAPAALVDSETQKLAVTQEKLKKIEEKLLYLLP